MSSAEDQADVERVLAGDIAAFEGIVRRWQAPLVNLAYRFTGDRARAEEMSQDAFLRVYKSLAQWRRDAAFSTWLFAVAANVYSTELRRHPAVTIALDQIAEPRDRRQIHDGIEAQDQNRIVRQTVAALPPKYRDAVILYYFNDMDVTLAARSLGLPEGTLKARLSRGRDILRGKLAKILHTQSLEQPQ